MTEKEFKSAEEFCGKLGELRIQTADGPLLDQCQTTMRGLVAFIKDKKVEFDPEPKPEGKEAPKEGEEKPQGQQQQ